MATKQWIERRKVGRGFQYLQHGAPITDKQLLVYLRSLHIPPAWRDVHIASGKRAKIRAIGTDAAGRRQYMYHPTFRARQEQEKFDRLTRFIQAIPRMRQITERHLTHKTLDQQKVLACIVRLMDEAYFRVGNDVYARTNKSYGLTTLRSRHTSVEGHTITFDFIGKSGQRHTKRITDRTLARVMKQLDELPGQEVFKYYGDHGVLHTIASADVNAYIKECMGEEFSAKDFRTWGGTLIAIQELCACERARSEHERKKTVAACVRKVAKKLGNTPAVARGSYIDPRIISMYMRSDRLHTTVRNLRTQKDSAYLLPEERQALAVLEKAIK